MLHAAIVGFDVTSLLSWSYFKLAGPKKYENHKVLSEP